MKRFHVGGPIHVSESSLAPFPYDGLFCNESSKSFFLFTRSGMISSSLSLGPRSASLRVCLKRLRHAPRGRRRRFRRRFFDDAFDRGGAFCSTRRGISGCDTRQGGRGGDALDSGVVPRSSEAAGVCASTQQPLIWSVLRAACGAWRQPRQGMLPRQVYNLGVVVWGVSCHQIEE